MVIHGTMDGVVPYEHGKDLFAKAAKPYKFVSLEGAGHNDIEMDYKDELFEGIGDFLDYLEADEKSMEGKEEEEEERGEEEEKKEKETSDGEKEL